MKMFSKTAPPVLISPSFTLETNEQIYVILLLVLCEIYHKMDNFSATRMKSLTLSKTNIEISKPQSHGSEPVVKS